MNLVTIIILEVIPIILWACGWYLENKATKYPDMKKGYKVGSATNNEKSWVYGNKLASKIFSTTGSILFIIIPIGVILFDLNLIILIFISFIMICMDFFIIEGIIKKKIKNS